MVCEFHLTFKKEKKKNSWAFLRKDFLTCPSSGLPVFLCAPTAPINQHSRGSVSIETERQRGRERESVKWKHRVALNLSAVAVMLEMNVIRCCGLSVNCHLTALQQPSPSVSFP